MRDRSTKLRHEVSVYRMIEIENELAEKDRVGKFVKNAYCEIVSQGNKETKTAADTEYNEQTYRLTFRKQSILEIKKTGILCIETINMKLFTGMKTLLIENLLKCSAGGLMNNVS